MSFDLFHAEKKDGQSYCRRFLLWPNQWTKFSWDQPLKWKALAATKESAKSLPESPGVYIFVISPGIADMTFTGMVGYIGKAADQTLRTRCSRYFQESEHNNRFHIGEMMHLWADNLTIWFVETLPSEATPLEDELIAAFLPPFNRDFPVSIGKIAKSIYNQ